MLILEYQIGSADMYAKSLTIIETLKTKNQNISLIIHYKVH